MISVRQAELHDLAEMTRLYKQASEFHVPLDPRLAAGSEGVDKFRKTLQPMLGRRSNPVFVAEENRGEKLLGYAIGKVVNNKPFAVPEYGYISCLYVDEQWRARGIGHRLLSIMHDWFKAEEVDAVQVEVSHYNPMGRQFWEEWGFTYFLDHLYRDTEPEVRRDVGSAIVIRQAELGDMEAVLGLWEEMMDYHAPLDRRLKVFPGRRGYVARAIQYWLRDDSSCLLAAEEGGTVLGFALGGQVDSGFGLKPAVHGHIAHMCVTAERRRHGIGRQLFARLRDWFQEKDLSSIHIYVSHFSPVSQQFWRMLGFDDYIERLWCDL